LAVPNTGYDLASFLLGDPASTTFRPAASNQYLRGIGYSFFGQDDWRLSSVLSLNIGLRYEYTSPFTDKYGHLANIDLGPGFSSAAVVTSGSVTQPQYCQNSVVAAPCYTSNGFPPTMVNPDRNNFGPRIGLAWRAMKKGNMVVRTGYGMYYNEGVYNQIAQRLALEPPFTGSANAVQNCGNLSLESVLQQTSCSGQGITNAYAVSRNFPDTYISTWNMQIQRDMPGNMVLQVTYTGSKGTRLPVYVDANQLTPSPVANAGDRPLPISNAGEIQFEEPVGNSILHQGQVQLIRRMRNNLSFQLSYTLTSAFDDASGSLVMNPLNINADRAYTSGDSKDAIAFQWTFQSPVDGRKGFLANKGFLTKALKDWTFNNTTQWQTGKPFTPTVSGDLFGIGNLQGLSERADATGLPVDSGSGYFNLAAFTAPPPGLVNAATGAYTYAYTAGRDTIFGPDQITTNLNFSRTFELKERKSLEFQVNSTNPINHPNISSFGTTVNALGYGVPTGAGGMRTITATLRFRM
jgi:trimeric autotransporter adhesin